MTMTTVRRITLTEITCCHCTIVFAVPEEWEKNRRETHSGFHCPNGHPLVFNGPSEAEKLRKELEQRERDLSAARNRATHLEDQRAAAERSNSALRGVITRTKKRAQAGQCPACVRLFPNLAAHMGAQHPDWAGTDALHEAPTEDAVTPE